MLNSTPKADAEILRHLAKDRQRIVEIGTFIGGTAEVIAGAMPKKGHLTTVDCYFSTPRIHWGQDDGQIQEMHFTNSEAILLAINRLERYRDRITQIIGDSVKVASTFQDASLDMVFIDGAHDYKSVMGDLKAWMPKLKPDGLMSGHDYNAHEALIDPKYAKEKSLLDRDPVTNIHFGVARALKETFTDWMRSTDTAGSVWWCGLEKLK